MTPAEIDAWLNRSLGDLRLSRSERQGLGQIAEASRSVSDLEVIRHRAFELARTRIADPGDLPILEWLEDVVKALREQRAKAHDRPVAEAYFSPGDQCARAIIRLLEGARKTVDVCVFTITDDRLAEAMLSAHRRGVSIRVVTDNAKSEDLGSDVEKFEKAGIPVRVDRSPFHMHHKFAIFDGQALLTGSYNWTRGAAFDNEENLIVTNETRLVGQFTETFDRLWSKLS